MSHLSSVDRKSALTRAWQWQADLTKEACAERRHSDRCAVLGRPQDKRWGTVTVRQGRSPRPSRVALSCISPHSLGGVGVGTSVLSGREVRPREVCLTSKGAQIVERPQGNQICLAPRPAALPFSLEFGWWCWTCLLTESPAGVGSQ